MPNDGHTCPMERANAIWRVHVPNERCTCPRECAHTKRRAHMPKGEFGVSRGNLGFPRRILCFRAKFGVSKGIPRVPNGGCTWPDRGNPKFSPHLTFFPPRPAPGTPNSPHTLRFFRRARPREPQILPTLNVFSAAPGPGKPQISALQLY